MGFKAISIEKYIRIHLVNNPTENEVELRARLNAALTSYKNGLKCSCGSDIWVIGSAFVGNSCYTCITGNSFPSDDYELDGVSKENEVSQGRRHIDDMDVTKICGFFDDDGYEINTDLIKKPSLCLICKNNDIPDEELLCSMTRYDQRNDSEFICFAFRDK